MRTLIILLLSATLTGCSKEVILTEETIPDEIFYPENTHTPYTGKCIIYYKNSTHIHYSFNFKKGILNGSFKSFYRNGKIEYSGNYSDGELTGEIVKYDENGEISMKHHIKD